SLQEGRIVRSDEISKEERERRIAESIKRLDAMTDEDIDYSDIPQTTPEQWAQAIPNPFYRPVKDQVTLRLDRYVLEWFRQNHEKYQTAINAALIEHIRRERAAKADQ
ncbi:MAG: BrnA antitoxin family protein, partial [Chloroflexota bacterium]|nr:BrnA antitoxin family protein [Chloroflexota bacterium]